MFQMLIRDSLFVVSALSLLPLSIMSLVGLVVSILQTATQIQEQSISFLIKISLLALMILFAGSYAAKECVLFTQRVISTLDTLG